MRVMYSQRFGIQKIINLVVAVDDPACESIHRVT